MASRKCNSIYDLAEISGFSYGTVSRVLNGRDCTSEAARKAILKAAAEYNFRPRMKARKTTVAFLVELSASDLHGSYLTSMVANVINALSQREVAVEIFTNHNVHQLNEGLVDAIIAMPWNEKIRQDIAAMKKIPRVLINHGGIEGCSVAASDHEQGGRAAAELLLNNGHTNVGIILSTDDWGNHQRMEGFRKYYAENGITLPLDFCGFLTEQPSYALLNQIIASGATGIFIGMENFQLELMNIMQMMEVSVPSRLSVVTMENPLVSKYITPGLTTIFQPLGLIAEKAVSIALDKVFSKDVTPVNCLLENTVITRKSVASIK